MAVRTFNYTEDKVRAEQERLVRYSQSGQPLDYEIKVDGIKAVIRTNDPSMFQTFETYMDENTKKIEILLFNGNSNYNDRHIYILKPDPEETGLGEVEINNIVEEALRKEREVVRYQRLEEDNQNLKQEITGLEKEIEELEKEIKEHEKENAVLQEKISPLNNVLGTVGANVLETFIRKNPRVLKGIPGAEALGGLLGPEGNPSANATTDASYESVSEDEQKAVKFMEQLHAMYSEEEFVEVVEILTLLSANKSKIKIIKEQLKAK